MISARPAVHVSNRQKDLSISTSSVKALVRVALAFEQISCRELSVYFVTEQRITQLHEEFFNDPTPTDCITFPIDEDFLGELFICPKTAQIYAAKHHLNPYEETSLYVVHGILHLLGYDDLTPAKRRTMRKKEKKCMAHLNALGVILHAV